MVAVPLSGSDACGAHNAEVTAAACVPPQVTPVERTMRKQEPRRAFHLQGHGCSTPHHTVIDGAAAHCGSFGELSYERLPPPSGVPWGAPLSLYSPSSSWILAIDGTWNYEAGRRERGIVIHIHIYIYLT